MESEKDLALVSLVARVTIGAYMTILGLNAFREGLETFIWRMDAIFQATPYIPSRGIRLAAFFLPYAQLAFGAALVLGVKLRLVWLATAALLIGYSAATLAIGRYDVSAAFLPYLLLVCVGLATLRHDTRRLLS